MHKEELHLEHGSWLHFLYTYGVLPDWVPEAVPVTWFIILVIIALGVTSTRQMQRVPGGLQNAMEWVYCAFDSFTHNVMGSMGSRYIPFIGTTFIFIFAMNIFGLIPGFISPTANINTTAALALTAFLFVQFSALRHVGVRRYFSHFVGEPLWLAPIMIPIHIIGEMARPFSLAIRLFGNIFGKEMILTVMIIIIIQLLGVILIPLQAPMVLFALFLSFVQALVFTMLISIYLAIAIEDHDEHAHHTEGGV